MAAMSNDEATEIDAPLPVPDDDDDDDAVTIAADRHGGDPLAPGRMLGDYRIATVVGVGGMGIVLGAIHPLIGKRVAIKVLKTDDPAMISRFVDEASIVNQIRHPNIVDIFGFGTLPDGRRYMVMEWLDGESLRGRMDRGRIPVAELIDILRPLLDALAAAHAHGVIHRDLKPENIFLAKVHGARWVVKLLDFGIAKLARDNPLSQVQTASGVMVGTPAYAAPEQAAGKPIDHRSDIYTLGVLLFEILTGRPPFIADSAMLVVAKHMLEPPPRPSGFIAVPHLLDEMVNAMLAKDPIARPSLDDMARILDRLARGDIQMVQTGYGVETPTTRIRPVTAPQHIVPAPLSAPTQPLEEPKRSRALIILFFVAAVLTAIAAGLKIAQIMH